MSSSTTSNLVGVHGSDESKTTTASTTRIVERPTLPTLITIDTMIDSMSDVDSLLTPLPLRRQHSRSFDSATKRLADKESSSDEVILDIDMHSPRKSFDSLLKRTAISSDKDDEESIQPLPQKSRCSVSMESEKIAETASTMVSQEVINTAAAAAAALGGNPIRPDIGLVVRRPRANSDMGSYMLNSKNRQQRVGTLVPQPVAGRGDLGMKSVTTGGLNTSAAPVNTIGAIQAAAYAQATGLGIPLNFVTPPVVSQESVPHTISPPVTSTFNSFVANATAKNPTNTTQQTAAEAKESSDRWRNRLWPGKAVLSYCRMITRCGPPAVTVGQSLMGLHEDAVLTAHWKDTDLPRVSTYFEKPGLHSSTFFMLTVEESRAAISSGVASLGAELHDVIKSPGESETVGANGWLDCEFHAIVRETETQALPSRGEQKMASVWVVTVAIHTPGVNLSETLSGSRRQRLQTGKGGKGGSHHLLAGGDLMVLAGSSLSHPLLALVQPWDPDYDTRFSNFVPSYTSYSATTFASDAAPPPDYTLVNLLLCVHHPNGPMPNTGDIGGWAHPGMVATGGKFSMVRLGNAMTYIRECQALMSLRLLRPALTDAILAPGPVGENCAVTINANPVSGSATPTEGVFPHNDVTTYPVTSTDNGINTGGNSNTPAEIPDDEEEASLPPPLNVPKPLWNSLCREYNASQLRAIRMVCRRDAGGENPHSPVCLLQGPPGTGKTKTILAILAVLLAGGLTPRQTSTRVLAGVTFRHEQARCAAAAAAAASAPNNTDVNSTDNVGNSTTTMGTSMTGTNSAPTGSDSVLKKRRRADSEAQVFQWGTTRPSYRPRILVCAPSNTAVDELVYRLLTQGVLGADGYTADDVSILRVGGTGRDDAKQRAKAAAAAALDVASGSNGRSGSARFHFLRVVDRASLDYIVETRRNNILATTADGKGRVTSGSAAAGHSTKYSDLRRVVLERADIVCCTLSGAGSQPLLEALLKLPAYKFDAVIVDEAAQAAEPSALIALKFNPKITVLVGDPCQLPATVFSQRAKEAGYARSLFKRLQAAGRPLALLSTQYRMHAAIAAYPTASFYDGRLLTAACVRDGNSHVRPFHKHPSGLYRPLLFHDLPWGVEERSEFGSGSLKNIAEAVYIVSLYESLLRCYPTRHQVGVIAAYREQRNLLSTLFRLRLPVFQGILLNAAQEKIRTNHITSLAAAGLDPTTPLPSDAFDSIDVPEVDVEIATVDGFQGREKELIIFSCVRSGNNTTMSGTTTGNSASIGFLREWQRLNVAITRAKCALWIVGNAAALETDSEWQRLVAHCKAFDAHHFAEPGDIVSLATTLGVPFTLPTLPSQVPAMESENPPLVAIENQAHIETPTESTENVSPPSKKRKKSHRTTTPVDHVDVSQNSVSDINLQTIISSESTAVPIAPIVIPEVMVINTVELSSFCAPPPPSPLASSIPASTADKPRPNFTIQPTTEILSGSPEKLSSLVPSVGDTILSTSVSTEVLSTSLPSADDIGSSATHSVKFERRRPSSVELAPTAPPPLMRRSRLPSPDDSTTTDPISEAPSGSPTV